MIAIMIMLFSLPVNAQGTVGYAKWEGKTLIFYGGESVPEGAFELNTGEEPPQWGGTLNCTTVVFHESFKDVRPTSCYHWFWGFEKLTTIQGIENLNTEEVTNMSGMFSGCSGLTSLDLSSFNTAKVEYMAHMFDICSDLTSLDLSSFNTAKVVAMDEMFINCKGLTTIYVSDDFKIGDDTNGLGMFSNCTSLVGAAPYDSNDTGIEMANYKTGYFTKSNLTPYVKWDASTKVLTFKVANNKEEGSGVYDLNKGANDPGWLENNNCEKVVFTSSFNHAKPTSCYHWFKDFNYLTTIEGIENLNTDEVTDMSYMFYNCRELTSLNLSSFYTANVTNMSYMFSDCPILTSLTLSSFFNTANVTDMNSMFSGCSSLTSLDLSKFNTDKVENMSSMFNGCSDLENLTLSSFNTANVTNMYYMFNGCSGLKSLNLSNFNTAKVENMSYMFSDCKELTSLTLSSFFNTANVTNMNNMFYGCGGLTALDLSSFNTANVTDMSCMFCWCSRLTSLDLSSFNTAKVEYMSYMFNGCSGLNSLNLSSFKTANVTNMNYMFNGCSGLTTIYVSDDFDTDDGTSGSYMFSGCSHLVGAASYSEDKIDKSMANYDGYFTPKNITPYVKWDANAKVLTFKVANSKEGGSEVYDLNVGENEPEWVGEVYSDCEKVVFTPSFKQARPTSCNQWFLGFSNLTTIQGIENLNTEEVTDMSEMFNSCSGLKNLDLSSFNTAKVTDMGYMFSGSYDLISLDLSSFNTAKVTDMSDMFNNCQSLKTIYASDGFTTGEDISSDGMFGGCLELEGATSWDLGKTDKSMANFDGYFTPKTITPYVKWDASTKVLTFKVANSKEEGVYGLNKGANDPGWFIDEVKNNCTKVVFTSSFNHAKPTSCYKWFDSFSNLTKIEGIENLNTEKVTDMSYMFQKCSGLASLDVSKFNTAEVENMSGMFRECTDLSSLDLSSFNTANVKDMSGMFWGCSGLTSLDLSSFNTAKVENMSYMFSDCSGLENLDLSSFNTAEVTDMHYMFPGCSGLTTIYVSDDFTTGDGTDGHEMFKDCTSLEGAAKYSDSGNTGIEMANYTTGYFKTYFTLGDSKVELCREPLTTDILDLSGEKDFVAHAPFTANEAKYSRDLSSSESTWFSLCLPFAYTPNNFTAYKLKGASANAVEIEEISGGIVAGTPVLFKFNDGVKKEINISATDAQIVKAPVDGATVNGTDGSSLQLCGTYQTKTFSTDDNNAFILLNNKLMNPARMLATGVTGVGVKPFRAYMTLTASAQTSSARAFSIGHGGEGNEGTTAIDLLNSVATDDAEYYDINGRRIDAPAKGVNIVRRGNKTIKLIIK